MLQYYCHPLHPRRILTSSYPPATAIPASVAIVLSAEINESFSHSFNRLLDEHLHPVVSDIRDKQQHAPARGPGGDALWPALDRQAVPLIWICTLRRWGPLSRPAPTPQFPIFIAINNESYFYFRATTGIYRIYIVVRNKYIIQESERCAAGRSDNCPISHYH